MTDKTEQEDSAESIEQLKSALPPDDPRIRVEQRCQQAGIKVAWRAEEFLKDPPIISVDMPNGKTSRSLYLSEGEAARFLLSDFENAKFLSDYEAVQFTDSQTIEAILRASNPGPLRLTMLPGAQVIPEETGTADPDDDEDMQPEIGDKELGSSSRARISPGDKWRAEFRPNANDTWRVQIGSISSRLATLVSRPRSAISITISGINPARHDDAVRILERVANAVLFECEVKYGIPVTLAYDRRRRYYWRRRAKRPSETPVAPRLQYHQDALSLYSYACSATGMPLLQYLAFYQVLEFYFPSYARREVLDRLRNQLKDPEFQLEEDAYLGRLIGIMKRYGAGYGNEQEQLKATVRACVEEEQIKSFLVGDEYAEKYFIVTSQVKGLGRLDLKDKGSDVRDQVSRRIYDLRCRIVHTKDEANDRVPELLLPFSAEANSIGPDIDLLKYLAQRALIANAVPLRL